MPRDRTRTRVASLGPLALLLAQPPGVAGQGVPERRAAESLRLGGYEAPEHLAFQREPGVRMGADGRVWLLNFDDPTVSVLDADGRLIRQVGGEGEGPGEFQVVTGLGFLGDTVWIRNWPTPRISLFTREGEHIATLRTDVDRGRQFSDPQAISHLIPGGAISVPGVPLGDVDREALPVFIGDRDLSNRGTMVEVARPAGLHVRGVGFFSYAPFAIPPLIAVSPEGTSIAIARWDDTGVGGLHLRLLDEAGAVVREREILWVAERLDPARRESAIDEGVERSRAMVERAIRQGQVEGPVRDLVEAGLHLPAFLPPIRTILIGADGTIWLERTHSGDGHLWHVLDAAGQSLFEVRLPDAYTLKAASVDALWATERGELDIPYVVRFDLEG